MPGRVLVVEDRDSLRKLVVRALEEEGFDVDSAADGEEARDLITGSSYQLVLTDLKLPGASGLEVLETSKRAQPDTPVVVLTAFGSVGAAVEAMKLGAADFLEKPIELDELVARVGAWISRETDISGLELPDGRMIVGRHPGVKAALRMLERVAAAETTVLLLGESGTGKELFAQALHQRSPRVEGPFVAVNCAAIPETLIENELFGHEKGAFTGANRREPGRFELARGGTLLLDEIGELPLSVQGKVLRVLEERTFERVGSGTPIEADVRLVAATNRDLESMIGEGRFRSDLFFRLDVFPIEIPPLRDRASDIPALARHTLKGLAARHGVGEPRVTRGAEELLMDQPWPGNVRQLSNVLERALILDDSGVIDAPSLREILGPAIEAQEKERVRLALEQTNGDKRQAALVLGVSYRTLQRRVNDFDLEGYPKYRS